MKINRYLINIDFFYFITKGGIDTTKKHFKVRFSYNLDISQ